MESDIAGFALVPLLYLVLRMRTSTVKMLVTFILSTVCLGAVQAKKLDPTIYYIKTINLDVQNCSVKKSLYNTEGEVIKKVCPTDYKTCVIEGTCALVSGESMKIINYVEERKGVYLFKDVGANCPYGYGVKNICLDPYYTVAADLSIHKPGEVIYVDKVKGTKLPNGEVHDGFFIIRDKGGSIRGADRFDFYTGLLHYKNDGNPFTPLGLAYESKSNPLSYRRATQAEAVAVRKARHFPGLPL